MSYEHTISVRLKKEFESFSNELIFRHLQLITCHVAIFKFTWDLGLPVTCRCLVLCFSCFSRLKLYTHSIIQASCRPHVRDVLRYECYNQVKIKHWHLITPTVPVQLSIPILMDANHHILHERHEHSKVISELLPRNPLIDVTLLRVQRCSKTLAMSNLVEALLLIITVPWIPSSTNRMAWPVRRMNL